MRRESQNRWDKGSERRREERRRRRTFVGVKGLKHASIFFSGSESAVKNGRG
jgi:hypothetical protein